MNLTDEADRKTDEGTKSTGSVEKFNGPQLNSLPRTGTGSDECSDDMTSCQPDWKLKGTDESDSGQEFLL